MGRGPGWGTVLGLTLVVLTFSVIHPLQLMMVPLALLLVALPPRHPRLLVFAAVLGALVFFEPRGPMWELERGWALLLSGWFIFAVLAWPHGTFVKRAVAAVAATVLSGGLLIAVRGGWSALDRAIAANYRRMAESVAAALPPGLTSGDEVVALAAELPARLFPAFLAVGSVAALAVAWWGYRRLSSRGEPLGRFTEFRFPDPFIWILIAGLALLLLPVDDWAPRVGSNLVFFMGALYALRGLAVLVALVLGLVGLQLPVLLVLVLVGVFLYPIVVAGTLLLGVTDTWLDLRSGRRTANDEG
ncbi:MAG: DUF2232 domain-containing protein [Gemmatimonadetes bacterium]|nr:DUF2232 domain-containing protein [Gemmatimonadota bacterium]NIQ58059.1 DUF2232 domain-containing protein [Gemmatimonadota bacterium]NIU78242.1 DUF2232 domain-containing protein [Gammaproteobacteria bacterium]NIX47227.1 DUF2232 domain-containing protein [Gemmatimonadota bacterium]NIY11600.1 DUF2232 domain-containing protein [Gemmatimonadota bacterium]